MGVLFKIHLFSYLIFLCFQPLPETVALVEDIVVEYVTDMVNVFIPRLGKKSPEGIWYERTQTDILSCINMQHL